MNNDLGLLRLLVLKCLLPILLRWTLQKLPLTTIVMLGFTEVAFLSGFTLVIDTAKYFKNYNSWGDLESRMILSMFFLYLNIEVEFLLH